MDVVTLALAKKKSKKQIEEAMEGAGVIAGKSAYQIALDNGFVGTEKQWLASLKGADGADGKNGVDGKDGADGKDGSPGIPGVKGDKGDKGNPGVDGRDGADGQDGKSFTIKAQYSSVEALTADHPTGSAGDAYFVGTSNNPDLYVWLTESAQWYNSGPIAGVKGDKGDPGVDGVDGVDGVNGQNGLNGIDGVDGDDGYSPTVTVKTNTSDTYILTVTYKDANGVTQSYDTPNLKGAKGEDGSADISDLEAKIGDLSELETTAKTDLVSAINEAAQSGGSGGSGSTSSYTVVAEAQGNGSKTISALMDELFAKVQARGGLKDGRVYTLYRLYDSESVDRLPLIASIKKNNATTQYQFGISYKNGNVIQLETYTLKSSGSTFTVTLSNNTSTDSSADALTATEKLWISEREVSETDPEIIAEITADGVKNWRTICQELYAQIEAAGGLNADESYSLIIDWSADVHVPFECVAFNSSETPSYQFFVVTNGDGTTNIKSTGVFTVSPYSLAGYKVWSQSTGSPTYADNSTGTPNAGTGIRLVRHVGGSSSHETVVDSFVGDGTKTISQCFNSMYTKAISANLTPNSYLKQTSTQTSGAMYYKLINTWNGELVFQNPLNSSTGSRVICITASNSTYYEYGNTTSNYSNNIMSVDEKFELIL
jgi:hypothetical protein